MTREHVCQPGSIFRPRDARARTEHITISCVILRGSGLVDVTRLTRDGTIAECGGLPPNHKLWQLNVQVVP